jgi:4-hydroxy-tetrahydrodipicolinate synthase
MIDCGISPERITLGVCASSISDALAQVQQGVDFGVAQFLLLPPFYFKGVDDAALFSWHEQLFQAADGRAKFILYHIPQVTQVPLSFDLVISLYKTFPERILAIKDSAGQWGNTLPLLESKALPVLVGDERLLHKAAALGGAGSICGFANLCPQRIRTLFDSQDEDVALSAEVDLIVSMPVIPALKRVMEITTGDECWGNLRAPLQALSASDDEKNMAWFAP